MPLRNVYSGSVEMADTEPGLSVHVKVTVDPSNTEAFLKALEPTFSNVKAGAFEHLLRDIQGWEQPGRVQVC